MSTHPQLEAKAILDGGGIVVRICPATSNLPTRMSEGGWQALCKSTRSREMASGISAASEIRRRLNYCGICKGKIRPPGLEIIPAAEMAALKQHHHREEAIMGKASGKCTACARSTGALSTCHGEKLCASCSAVYSAANNRPTVLLKSLRQLQPKLLEELAGSPAVQVSVESEALKRIAEAVGYDGEDGEVLVKAVQAMAAANTSNCGACSAAMHAPVAELQAEVDRLRGELERAWDHGWLDLCRAMGMKASTETPEAVVWMAAIQTAALLEETDRQLNATRLVGLRINDAVREQVDILEAINHAIGLPEDTEAEQIISNIGSVMQAVDRFRDLAEAAEKRADLFEGQADRLALAEAENERLNGLLDQQNDTFSIAIDPSREALADFGLAVIRGNVMVSHRG